MNANGIPLDVLRYIFEIFSKLTPVSEFLEDFLARAYYLTDMRNTLFFLGWNYELLLHLQKSELASVLAGLSHHTDRHTISHSQFYSGLLILELIHLFLSSSLLMDTSEVLKFIKKKSRVPRVVVTWEEKEPGVLEFKRIRSGERTRVKEVRRVNADRWEAFAKKFKIGTVLLPNYTQSGIPSKKL
jgi:hypothetical protein